MPMGDVNLEIEFDNSVILQANDGSDGKGPLGFYKYDRSVMGTPIGAHLELPKGSQPPAAVRIKK